MWLSKILTLVSALALVPISSYALGGKSRITVNPGRNPIATITFDRDGIATVRQLEADVFGHYTKEAKEPSYVGPISQLWLPTHDPNWGPLQVKGEPPIDYRFLRQSGRYAFIGGDRIYVFNGGKLESLPRPRGLAVLDLNYVAANPAGQRADMLSFQSDEEAATYVMYKDENWDEQILKLNDRYIPDIKPDLTNEFSALTGYQKFPPDSLPSYASRERFVPHTEINPFDSKENRDPRAEAEIILTTHSFGPRFRAKLRFSNNGHLELFEPGANDSWLTKPTYSGEINQVWLPENSLASVSGQIPSHVRFKKSGYMALVFSDKQNLYFHLGQTSMTTHIYSVPLPSAGEIVDINIENTKNGDGEISIRTTDAAVTYMIRENDGFYMARTTEFHHGYNPAIEDDFKKTFASFGGRGQKTINDVSDTIMQAALDALDGKSAKPVEEPKVTMTSALPPVTATGVHPILKRVKKGDRLGILYLDGTFELIDLITSEVLVHNRTQGFSARDISIVGGSLVVELKTGQRAVYSLQGGQYRFVQVPNDALRKSLTEHVRCERALDIH